MSDVRERLQSSLGATYTLERELGGGLPHYSMPFVDWGKKVRMESVVNGSRWSPIATR